MTALGSETSSPAAGTSTPATSAECVGVTGSKMINNNNPIPSLPLSSSSLKHSGPLSSLGDASGVAFLLGNHAKFGLAERCCYHFDLIETLTSQPAGRIPQPRIRRRDRGLSISSQDGGGTGIVTKEGTSNITSNSGVSPASTEGDDEGKKKFSSKSSSSSSTDNHHCYCGVVSLLECCPGSSGGGGGGGGGAYSAERSTSGATGGGSVGAQPDRSSKRTLRSKHREFNSRAQVAWGKTNRGSASGSKRHGRLRDGAGAGAGQSHRRCHQPRHLPLPLNPSTRVTFAYELTSIALVVDASPSLTSTFESSNMFDIHMEGSSSSGEEKNPSSISGGCCLPLDRLGPILKTYLQGLVKPIDVPPVAVSGLGVAFGRWTPNLAVTVVAAYPPTARGDRASAGLLVRDFRVTDANSALELAHQVERWALREVEGMIAERLSGERSFLGDGVGGRSIGTDHGETKLESFGNYQVPQTHNMNSWMNVKTSMKELMEVGDAALSTLPPEGRPLVLVVTDCKNVHCGGIFEALQTTARSDVPLNVLDLSAEPNFADKTGPSFLSFPLSISDDSQSVRDACNFSGGIYLQPSLLNACISTNAGSPIDASSPLYGDYHLSFKRRTIRPNALQWYTLFTISPFTPYGASSPTFIRHGSNRFRSGLQSFWGGGVSSNKHQSHESIGSFGGYARQISLSSLFDNGNRTKDSTFGPSGGDLAFSSQTTTNHHERISFSKYNIQPIRIKSLLMTRVLEGYRARRYGHNTQDPDKVSIHMTLNLADLGIILHYEISFVSSPYHIPIVGQAHIKIELSGGDPNFIQTVKKMFISHHGAGDNLMQQGRRISSVAKTAAEKICKLLRWIRKEDYLESYLCLPGWGDINHFAPGSSFLRRLENLTHLQRYRHFRSEVIEAVVAGSSPFENRESLFGDLMEHSNGEEEMFTTLSSWATGVIADRSIYFKVLVAPNEENLALYCVLRVQQSLVSRLFIFSLDFHGELDAEQRLSVLSSFREHLRCCTVILKKNISDIISIRPSSPTKFWNPTWKEYFLHHKSWDLIKDTEVLRLITKRRHQIGGFFILHADDDRAVFAKFVQSDSSPVSAMSDIVVYQVLNRSDGIFVDIHMESCRAKFHPFLAKSSTFNSIFEKVRKRDKDCAKNLRSRTNLLAALDHGQGESSHFHHDGDSQAEDVLRLIRVASSRTQRKLRFFQEGSGSANEVLYHLTTDHMTSSSFQNRAAKLLIDQDRLVGSHCGTWFIMRVDWYVLSVIQFSLIDRVESEDEGFAYRNLNFYTIGITDLYQSDDDVAKKAEGVSDDKNEHYFGVSEIADEVEKAHGKNFSKALYMALRNHYNSPISSLQIDDISNALEFCTFKEVLRASISLDDLSDQLSSDAETMTGRKLIELLQTLVSLVPGSDDSIFYFSGEEISDFLSPENACVSSGLAMIPPLNLHDVDDDFSSGDEQSDSVDREAADDATSEENEGNTLLGSQPPMFFRFKLDGVSASLRDILSLKKSTTLSTEVTVFGESEKFQLPHMHARVISQLRSALASFSSEQTLEKYRFFGKSLTQDDFKIIMRNLPQTKHHSYDIPLEFFVSRSDCLVPASNPTGSSENDLDHGFGVLTNEFDRHEYTIRASNDSFLVLDDAACRNVFPFWCFVEVRKDRGSVEVRVYHPGGESSAASQGEVTRKLVEDIVHQTNQLLLLESLYRTKNASKLLIPEEATSGERRQGNVTNDGKFSCPIQYKMPMPLNHRVAPNQAIVSLDSTVLQNFMVSNRRGIFTYLDESDNIFYMTLNHYKTPNADDDGEHNPNIIELQVHGLAKPGPSITEQLARLLRKKLLLLPLDALSTVLKKNPYYQLLPADMAFINSFRSVWRELEHDIEQKRECSTKIYELPAQVQDPILLLLMFRQNISGSTFIQHLHESTEDKSMQVSDVMQEDDGGNFSIRFLPKEFLFYFNSSPSQLDPNYQPVTTLTERGKQYSRQAGSGIAIIEINLLRGDGSQVGKICTGKAGATVTNLRASKHELSLLDVTDTGKPGNSEHFRISVKITNTTVDMDILQKWVHLSLSQVLVAWSIEQHISWHKHICSSAKNPQKPHPYKEEKKLELINQTMPGLSALSDMLEIGANLPHPTINKVHKEKMLPSTLLASTLLSHLSAILGTIFNQKVMSFPVEGVDIVRYTSAQGATKVTITSDHTNANGVRVELLGEKKTLKDKTTDNPEYVCVFGLGHHGEQNRSLRIQTSQLFFKDINAGRPASEESAFSQALQTIKKAMPSLFERGFIFILSVTRCSRSLVTFNINPQVLASMKIRFLEIEEEKAKVVELHRSKLRNRCLPFLPDDHSTAAKEQVVRPTDTNANKQREKTPAKEDKVSERGSSRRIPRPTSMLRPKLIGKSVEGSAMQAVAASRLRASSRPTAPQRTASGSGQRTPNASQSQSKSSKDKTGPERKTPAAQKLQRGSIVSKDSSSRALSAAPPPLPRTTQLKVYRDFIAMLRERSDVLSLQYRLSHSSLQLLIYIFLTATKSKGSPATTRLSLQLMTTCYGNFLRSGLVEQLQCDQDAFAAHSLFEFITKRWSSRNDIVPMGDSASMAAQPKHANFPYTVYFKKDLLASASRVTTIVMEVSISWHNSRNSHVFAYRAWLVNSTDVGSKKQQSLSPGALRKTPFASFGSLEREAGLIDAMVFDFFNRIELEREVFNFAGFRLVQAARSRQRREMDTLSLLRSCMNRFSPESQERLPCLEYRIQRRFLSPSSFLHEPLLQSCEKASFIDYLTKNSDHHGLINCTGIGDTCYSGKLTIVGLLVHYFISWHESVESAFEIFVLSVAKGHCMDAYITNDRSQFAERISDVILHSSMTTVQQLIKTAAKEIRKHHLWDMLGNQYKKSLSSITATNTNITELREMSHHIDLTSVDPRLLPLMCDECNDFRIPWQDVLSSIQQSTSFSHIISVSQGGDDKVIDSHVVYCRDNDMFLDFRLDQSGKVVAARVIAYNLTSSEDPRVRSITELFSTFILQWIWNDTSTSF